MSFIPFLTFDGQARAAMEFYADLFNSTDTVIQTFAEAPAGSGVEPSDRVMYSHIMLGDACLMAGDSPPGMAAPPQQSVAVNHIVEEFDEARAIFDKLAEGGEVQMPYAPAFFAKGFGMLRDRFGTNWIVIAGAS